MASLGKKRGFWISSGALCHSRLSISLYIAQGLGYREKVSENIQNDTNRKYSGKKMYHLFVWLIIKMMLLKCKADYAILLFQTPWDLPIPRRKKSKPWHGLVWDDWLSAASPPTILSLTLQSPASLLSNAKLFSAARPANCLSTRPTPRPVPSWGPAALPSVLTLSASPRGLPPTRGTYAFSFHCFIFIGV